MLVNVVTRASNQVASFRYRSKVIQEGCLYNFIPVKITPYFDEKATTCIYSKHWNLVDYSDAIGAKAAGKHVIFDVCDDHFETEFKDHYLRMCAVADQIVCNSEQMQERIREVTGKKARVVDDPILLPPQEKTDFPEKVLWFGGPTSLPGLIDNIEHINGFDLEVVCSEVPPIKREGKSIFTPWGEMELINAMRRNTYAFLPYSGERINTKSANRIAEALNAEMIVVSNGIPASEELKPYIYSLEDSIGPDSVQRAKNGAEYVRDRYSKKRIFDQWSKVFK